MNMYGNSSGDNYVPIEDISDEIDGLPEKKTAEQLAGYIPIYTKEQFAKIASGETCAITDLSGNSKGSYTMAVDAKYALMNDLDFQSASTKPIKNFKGEFEGNGCTISNLNIDTTGDTSYTRPDGKVLDEVPAGLFESVVNGKISNLAVTNSKFTAKESFSAIVGHGDNITIENCYSKNNTFLRPADGGGASGSIIGYVCGNGANINNCKAIYTTYKSEKSGLAFGGICGASNGKISINNCKVIGNCAEDNIYQAGIIDCALTDINILNCGVQNIKVKEAGIIGKAVTNGGKPSVQPEMNISNCTVKKVSTGEAGVVFCSGDYYKTNISGCKVEKLTADAINTGNSMNVGGIVSIAFNITITDCNVKDLNIISNANLAGGIIGDYEGNRGNDSKLYIGNCKVEDVKINNTSKFGGMICVGNGMSTIENCSVNNIEGEINGFVGGIAGNLLLYTNDACVISKCYANNLNVTSHSDASGILGYGNNLNISDCVVSNSKIDSTNNGVISSFIQTGTITGCITKNVDLINTQGKVGEIVGGTNGATIDNCHVYGGSITSTSEYSSVGGICGLGTNASNCTVENLIINAGSTSSVGGIIGNGKNEISTSLIQNCSVKNCKIKGKNYVGGIAGAASINISNCQVEGSTIEGTDSVGGIQGFGGEFANTATYVPVKIDKGEVTNTEIKGTTNVNNIQGCNTYVKDSTDATKDTITNCKYNGSAVTQ